MLHIHNGDSSAGTARQSSLPGEHVAWRESLITGPTPGGLLDSEWRRERARHLSEAYGKDEQECERGLLLQEEALAAYSKHDEVVLWFEHDLFCQLHLIYLLNWFSQHELGQTKLSLICINEFPGKENFRGLGELNSEQLASLFPNRREVTLAQLDLAAAAWNAYCAPEPTNMEKVLQTDTSPLPFLQTALQVHLERFPSTKNGLGRVENRVLELVHNGPRSFTQLFRTFGDAEPVYGFGDAQFWLTLHRLAAASTPLLKITGIETGPGQRALAPEVVQNAKFEITEPGDSVRKGETDFVTLNDVDLWLGGVHLREGRSLWRWNEKSGKVVSISN